MWKTTLQNAIILKQNKILLTTNNLGNQSIFYIDLSLLLTPNWIFVYISSGTFEWYVYIQCIFCGMKYLNQIFIVEIEIVLK